MLRHYYKLLSTSYKGVAWVFLGMSFRKGRHFFLCLKKQYALSATEPWTTPNRSKQNCSASYLPSFQTVPIRSSSVAEVILILYAGRPLPNCKSKSIATHETAFTSKAERESCEQFFSRIAKCEVHYTDYEEAVSSTKSINANKNAYIMRNQEMIDNSDVCIFYYNKDYLPPKRKAPNKFLPDYQPKSGTAIAYAYAVQKKKQIYNMYIEE